jgi:tight adherence protein C
VTAWPGARVHLPLVAVAPRGRARRRLARPEGATRVPPVRLPPSRLPPSRLPPSRLTPSRLTPTGWTAAWWTAAWPPLGRLCRSIGAPPGRWVRSAGRCVGLDVPVDEAQLGAGVLVSAAVISLAPPLVLPTIAVIAFGPAWRRRRRRLRHEQELVADLPVVIELFRLAVGAGSSVHQAVPAVAARSPHRFRGSLHEVVAREAMGEPLAEALAGLGAVGAAVRPLAVALAAAERDGSALCERLDRLAAEARLAHRRRAEEAARRLPVQLLFPLVGCVLPAFGLLTVVPLLVASLPHLS